jgi:hypothetical protein
MSFHQYVVVNLEGQWTVLYQGIHYGPYSTQDSAVQAALASANVPSELDEKIEVVVMEVDNQIHTKWTFGGAAQPAINYH